MSVGGPHRSAIALSRPGPGRLRGRRARRCRAETLRATRASVGSAVASATSPTARLARSDRGAAAASGQPPDPGHGPVRRRSDRELRGRDPRPAGDQPRRDRQPPSRVEPRAVVPAVPHEQDDLDRGLDPSNGPGDPAPADLRRRVRRRLDAGSGRPRARCPAGPGRRGGPAGPSGPHAHDHHPALPGRRPGLADPGRSGPGGEERRHRGAGLGHLARTPIVQGPGARSVPPRRRVRVRRRLRPRR